MVKLLMRFYDVTGGAIQVDGHDIRDFNRQELRDAFGMVLQDTWLFKGSIMENIRYGRLDATDEEVIEAAKAAHAHHFIQTLPGGYQMELNEDASNVSQGQKQLLTIARAILADNPILILDEATSSVDTRTEVRIQKALDNLMRGQMQLYHCTPALYDKKCGSDSGDERWRYHRAGNTRTASGAKGILCRSV